MLMKAGELDTKQLIVAFKLSKKGFTEDEEYYYFKGYASTFGNEDLGGDVVLPGAFLVSLKERTPKLCWQHDIKDPIGVFTKCSEDEKGLYVEGKMPKDNQHCKDIASLVKCGAIDSMSIGYAAVDVEFADGIRYLKELKLYEVSFITIPMNERAKIDMKSVIPFQDLPLAGVDAPWRDRDAVARVKAFCKADAAPNASYARCFLWHNIEEAKSFEAYIMPIADIIDGKLCAIPRALFNAAAALQSNKGDGSLSSEDVAEMKRSISKYYEKLSLVAPWDESEEKSAKIIDNIKSMKDVNEFLRSKGLSNLERTGIIAKIKQVADDARNEKSVGELLCNTELHTALSSNISELNRLIKAAAVKN